MEKRFDPDAAAAPGAGIFGLETPVSEAAAVVVPVPFDATTSFRRGAARGPAAVLAASHQVELCDVGCGEWGEPWRRGIAMLEPDPRIAALNREAVELARPVIARGGDLSGAPELTANLERVDAIGAELGGIVEAATGALLDDGVLPAILGGDHSVSFGALRAACARHPGLGVLHLDAHADLREAFEGLRWSHASIFHNALAELEGLATLVQVGLRDLGRAELERIETEGDRVHALFDHHWAGARMAGRDLRELVRATLEPLPERVWISFDVDALEPALCPNTGTPVPGGLDWNGAWLWLDELGRSQRRVVGFDLVEIAPGEGSAGAGIDENVGARLLYRLIATALRGR